MSSRSAEASIKGYNYQFLHTIKDILGNERDTYENIVEGIEDLDIVKENSSDLIQYKYHEEQSYQNSKVAKPIALMFKHFLVNQNSNINYKLFIYLNTTELPDITTDTITDILKIKESRKILSGTNTELTLQAIDSYLNDIITFITKFTWTLTQKYNELENDIILSFESVGGLSNEEAKIVYFSNAIKIINDLAIQSDEANRKITKRDLLSKLNTCKDVLYSSYILREKSFVELKKIVKKRKTTLNIKKNSSTHIIHINNTNRENISSLIISLVKKFCFKDNKSDLNPLVFIVSSTNIEYQNLKKSLYEYIDQSLILVNDGTEDYNFNINLFNAKPLVAKNRAGNKINHASFNFKLLHEEVYKDNSSDIGFSSPSLFVIDSMESNLSTLTEKQFYLNGLDNNQILELIGE